MMRNLLRVWLWLALLGPVAATAGGVFGPDSTARGSAATADAKAVAAQADATAALSGSANDSTARTSVANLASGATPATKVQIGSDMSASFSGARLLVGDGALGGTTSLSNNGIVSSVTESTRVAVWGVLSHAQNDKAGGTAYGVAGQAFAGASATGAQVGVSGSAVSAHPGINRGGEFTASNGTTNYAVVASAGGASATNYGLLASAASGTTNHAIHIASGGIGQDAATTWTATGGLTVDGGFSYAGKASGASDAAGYVGEIITATGTSAGLTTGTAANATSISVTAGQWIVTSQTYWNTAATTSITRLAASINTTSATHLAAASSVWVGPATVPTASAPLPATGAITRIINSSGTATYYATCLGVFTVSTLTCTATITAVRIR